MLPWFLLRGCSQRLSGLHLVELDQTVIEIAAQLAPVAICVEPIVYVAVVQLLHIPLVALEADQMVSMKWLMRVFGVCCFSFGKIFVEQGDSSYTSYNLKVHGCNVS